MSEIKTSSEDDHKVSLLVITYIMIVCYAAKTSASERLRVNSGYQLGHFRQFFEWA